MRTIAKYIIIILSITFVLFFLYITLAIIYPFKYLSVPIKDKNVRHILDIQTEKIITPEQCAVFYLNYEGDYQDQIPNWLLLKVKEIENNIIVTIINNKTQDDSIYNTIDVITLIKKNNQYVPVKHIYAHKGRGSIIWHIEPEV